MADSRTIPPPDFDDDDPAGQAAWEIATAETLRARGDLADAAGWYRRAANHLMEAGEDERAIEIAKLAAELVALESSVRPASERSASRAPSALPPTQPTTVAAAGSNDGRADTTKARTHEPAPGSAAAKIFGSAASSKTAPGPSAATSKSVFPTHSATAPNVATQRLSSAPSAVPRPTSGATVTASRSTASPSARVPLPGEASRPSAPAPARRVPGPAPRSIAPSSAQAASSPERTPSLRPSAFAAPASPAARTATTPALAPPAPPAQSDAAEAMADVDTSVISLGELASPIASLLDEAVADLSPSEAAAPAPVAKRPLSFLPQRAAESESIAARLSALPLFSELPPDALRTLSRQLITETRNADEHLCESGAPEGPLYVVLSGSAWVGVAGRASPISILTAGDIVGEVAALYGGPRTATVVAREPMELVGVAPSVVRAMAREFSSFRDALIETIRERMSEALPFIAPSLRRLPDEGSNAILAACEFVELPEGAELLVEGEPAPALYLIAAGEAECFGGELGVSRAVRARVGELIGVASTITGTPSGVSARAARTLLAARVARDKVRALSSASPSISELLEDVAAPGRGVVC
jgi:CRP-like cAMP-binding protein